MQEIISREELEEFKRLKGEVRGTSMRTEFDFVLKEKGKEGLEKFEAALAEMGFPLKHKEIKTMEFYPLTFDAVCMVTIQRLFGFDDDKIQEMGRTEAKFSILIRLFMKYFFSLKSLLDKVPSMWEKFFTVGRLEVAEFNEKKKYAILRLKDFRVHPVFCQDFIGYFSGILQMIVGGDPVCTETRCVFRGDEYDEFLLKWQ